MDKLIFRGDVNTYNKESRFESVDAFFTSVVSKLELPEDVFPPDQWTRAFLQGLNEADFDGQSDVLEIGIGSGVNAIYLLQRCKEAYIIGTDIKQSVLDTAKRNIQNILGTDALQRCVFCLSPALQYFGPSISEEVKYIIGCLPQVAVPHTVNINEKDNVANYYDPKLYPSSRLFDQAGLGLNDAVLKKAHAILPIDGTVILNLGGRPSKSLLLDLFNQYGYRTDILYEEMIAQAPRTSLESLVEIEKNQNDGFSFEFFADINGKDKINAAEAERRRLAGESLYHKIYVIQGAKVG